MTDTAPNPLRLGVLVSILVAVVIFAGFHWFGPRPPRNVVIVVLDTVRADRMSVYGHDRATTPFLDSIRDELLVFEDVRAAAPWTVPSHASIFTGTLPSVHRAQWGNMRLSMDHITLAEILQNAGLLTAGLTSNLLLATADGITQGFDHFSEVALPDHERTDAVLARVEGLLEGAEERGQGSFLFLNWMDAHIPYNHAEFGPSFGLNGRAPVETATDKWEISAGRRPFGEAEIEAHGAAYDAGIRYLDRSLERLFAILERRGILDETLVIITADHGEGLGAHPELGHTISIWEEQLRVPLIVRFPGGDRGGESESRPYSLTRLGGDILDWMEIPRAGAFADLPGLESEEQSPITAEVRSYFIEMDRSVNGDMRRRYPELAARTFHRHVLYCGGRKLMVGSDGSRILFDLTEDPREQVTLEADDAAECTARYEALLAEGQFTPFDVAAAAPMDEEEIEALRQLGYME